MNRKLYLVCYDIAHPRRLRQALAIVRDYALGGQKSAHECWMTEDERTELRARMRQLIDPAEDRFLIAPLNAGARFRTLGRGRPPENPDWFYVE